MAVQGLPAAMCVGLDNWNWKVVRQFVSERFGISLSRSSCLNYLHRLGFVLRRPRKHLLKADEVKREAFVEDYAALREEARRTGSKIFFADEAYFRAYAELRGRWVLKGAPALMDPTSPQRGEKASYYSAVCLETGEVEWMELEGNPQGRNLGRLPDAVAPAALRVVEGGLGQCSGSPGRSGAGLSADPWSGTALGESAGLQPGLQL